MPSNEVSRTWVTLKKVKLKRNKKVKEAEKRKRCSVSFGGIDILTRL